MSGYRNVVYLACRNCRERTMHEHIGYEVTSVSVRLFGRTLFHRKRRTPVYACMICRCERRRDADVVGPG